ncbi:hypothetical protein TGARI_313510 [Toxoplasma gondii ARI]|uniref:Uncharacterized protein n=1 Tax=Toxoplasma gondii ARI TaxID=1074872 RepID=A0A139Y9C3_TOXGO|nr:hypothetical protein TGARI_313510 [Toxoplasma gondii ARI]
MFFQGDAKHQVVLAVTRIGFWTMRLHGAPQICSPLFLSLFLNSDILCRLAVRAVATDVRLFEAVCFSFAFLRSSPSTSRPRLRRLRLPAGASAGCQAPRRSRAENGTLGETQRRDSEAGEAEKPGEEAAKEEAEDQDKGADEDEAKEEKGEKREDDDGEGAGGEAEDV